MNIAGIQKVSLIDYPEKIACTIFLHGCNFKCGFCHNPELVLFESEQKFSEQEVLDYLELRKKYLDGVCITGGEPLMTLDKNFLKKIKEMGYDIKIDTNGCFPEKLKELIDEKLVDFVAMDIKAGKENYRKITDAETDLEKIEKSIKLISDKIWDYEFRTTVIEGFHDENEMEKISFWLKEIAGRKPRKFVLQGFKNQGKLIGEKYLNKKNSSKEYIYKLKDKIKNYFENVEVRV